MKVGRYGVKRAVRKAIAAPLRRRSGEPLPSPRLAKGGPVVVLSPHMDDAVLSAWSVLLRERPHVANVFAGRPRPGTVGKWDRVCGADESAAHIGKRLREDRAALSAAGAEPFYLPFLDDQYRPPWGAPSQTALADALCAAFPDVSRVYAPAAPGRLPHPDHLLVRQLATDWAGTGTPVTLYAELPYAVLGTGRWPSWMIDGRQGTGRLPSFWRRLAAEVPAIGAVERPRVVRLSASEVAEKISAAKRYRSQLAAIDASLPVRGALTDPALIGYEIFWALDGGELGPC